MALAEEQIATQTPLRRATGPKGIPILGNLLEMGRDTLGFLERAANEYGDVTALTLGRFPALLVTESDHIEQVFVKKHQDYMKNRFFWRQLKALMGDGLFTAEGENWKRQRKLAAPAFASHPMQHYASHMAILADGVVSGWRDGQVFDMHKGCMDLALRVAAHTLLNADVENDLDGMDKATSDINDEVVARFSRPFMIPDAVPLPGHLRYRRGIEFIDQLIYRIISEHRAGKKDAQGFIALLMNERDEDGNTLSEAQLRDQIMNMLIAGYETTALNISWGFHLLGQHREIQNELAEEVRQVAGERVLTYDDLAKMPKIERATIEILRLYPPAWGVGREAVADTSIGDFEVPKGTTIIISSWVTHRRADYYDDPLAFRPERWTSDFRKNLPRFAYLPFGGGPRICIGNRFAMMEAMLMLATIVRRFDIERLSDHSVKPVASVTLRPEGGIWVKLNERG